MASGVYESITARIIAAIEEGAGTWRMPWHHSGADLTRPVNITSGKGYRGINTLSLWAAGSLQGFSSGVWGTYRQWQDKGAQVRKGAKGSLGVFWKELTAHNGDGERGNGTDTAGPDRASHGSRRLLARSFVLFNLDQVDGYEPEAVPVLDERERLAQADAFIAALGIETVLGSPNAYYSISQDRIHMPEFARFKDAQGFAATHLHECAHATGAKHRLDRSFAERWSKDALAMEEATAELTASFILADLGIAHEPRPDHAAYIGSWLRLLKHEPRAIFTAASQAQAAADWMWAKQPTTGAQKQRAANCQSDDLVSLSSSR